MGTININIQSICVGYLLCMLFYSHGQGQSLPSPLHSGTWAKFSVVEDGIYKIDRAQLRSAGFDVQSLDPRQLQLYGHENGMLPQPNTASRKNRLQEIAITVAGESDGIFNTGDYILFYGQNPDKKRYDLKKKIIHYENHLYSDKSFYFLTIGRTTGKRIASSKSVEGTHPVIDTYNALFYHEKDIHNILHSGRHWFGEQINPLDKLLLSLNMPGLTGNGSLQVVSGVMAASTVSSSFQLMLNETVIANQPIAPISGSRFGLKGNQRTDTLSIDASLLNTMEASQRFTYTFVSSNQSGIAKGYLDFLFVMAERKLSLYGQQTLFSSFASLNNSTGTFTISMFPQNGIIWDVTNPFTCTNQYYTKEQDKAVFSTQTTQLKTFIVVNTNRLGSPRLEGDVPNQNLHTNLSTDLLIIAHPLFKQEAERLANHRRTQQGINIKVVSIEQVYNDYSGGKQDPTAIRDLVRETYKTTLKNLLLFGRSSYDFKNLAHSKINYNYVPTYESRNSLNPLDTYASDDYFAFLEPREGEWAETPTAADHTMDIGVGRLPVKNPEEAKAVVDKLIAYDTERRTIGGWRKEILFVADDGDRNIHQLNADILAERIEKDHPDFNTQKIYLDAFEQVSSPSGQSCPDAREALKRALEQGALIVNFIGHGSEEVWLQERILDNLFIDEWQNGNAYPLLVTATCEFGRHDNPAIISGGEKTLIKTGGGSIALITATRPVRASSNTLLNRAFYDALLNTATNTPQSSDIGALFRTTKNNSTDPNSGISNRNFSLLGDPSMQLAIPKKQAIATSIKTLNSSDTLKALSGIVIHGEIRSEGIKDTTFNGTLQIVVKDKPFPFHTLQDPVDNNIPFTYNVRSNTLFRGEASVVKGTFKVEFVMPKNISHEAGGGKISLYAIHDNTQNDAYGGTTDIIVGGKETNTAGDNTPPRIRLFINDETFKNGSITASDIEFIAKLSDQSGINLSNYGEGSAPIIILDGKKIKGVSTYYWAEKDDFKKGIIKFSLRNLSSGRHTIELTAWDVYHNTSSATISFNVVKGKGIVIDNVLGYPNPFRESVRIQFTHNRPGDHLRVSMMLIDPLGKMIGEYKYDVPNSVHTIDLPVWNGSSTIKTKLMAGNIYLLRLMVRSLSDDTTDGKAIGLITMY